MRRKNFDLIIAVVIAIMNIAWAFLPYQLPVIRIILASPLVFLLPGYTATEALFYKESLNTAHRFLLSLALSIAMNIFGGFILNMLPGGLDTLSWALFLGTPIIAFSLLGAYLRCGTQGDAESPSRVRLTFSGVILFGMATSVAIFSVLYSAAGAAQQPHPGFTQLQILPAGPPGKSCAVRLGVRSFELTPTNYDITVTLNRTQIDGWPSISLAPQKEWNQSIPIVIPGDINRVAIVVSLYRSERPQTVYRQVHLTLYLAGISAGGAVQLCTTLPPISPSPQPTPISSRAGVGIP